jgi:hypothetical protein
MFVCAGALARGQRCGWCGQGSLLQAIKRWLSTPIHQRRARSAAQAVISIFVRCDVEFV